MNIPLNIFTIAIVGVIGLYPPPSALAYEYYDPYSNSNIDYFPTNPIDVSPSPSYDSPSNETSGSYDRPSTNDSSGATTKTTTSCANQPIPNPQNTISVEVRDASGAVFELSPPKTELQGWGVSPETSGTIYKGSEEVGLITVDNGCYPKYGYVLNPYKTPAARALEKKNSVPEEIVDSQTNNIVPEKTTAVTLDPATGKVYRASTGALIDDARYDPVNREIYYKNTAALFGKVFTETTGYVNIDYDYEEYTPTPSPVVSNDRYDYESGTNQKEYNSVKEVEQADDIVDKTPPQTVNQDLVQTGTLETDMATVTIDTIIEPVADSESVDINLNNDRIRKLRYDISTADQAFEVTTHGWDIADKKKIVDRPQDVKSAIDLEVYVEAIALNDTTIEGIEAKEDILEVTSREKGKLFGFIPVKISSKVSVSFKQQENAEDAIMVRYPWWHVFVVNRYDGDELKSKLSDVFDTQELYEGSDFDTSARANRIARMLKVISNAHKTP